MYSTQSKAGLICSLFLSIFCSALTFDGQDKAETASRLDDYLTARTAGSEFDGTVLVMNGTEVLFNKGYGLAHRGLQVPMTADSKMRIASLTKPLTALAVMKLVESGMLKLDDRLSALIPNCPPEWRQIKLKNLLTHTSGIRDHFGRMKAVPVADTAAEFERVIGEDLDRTLYFEPGTQYRYSNYGFAILGYILEKKTGKIYPEVMQELVLGPLNMNETVYDDPRKIILNRAYGYNRANGGLIRMLFLDPASYSAGGYLSTTGDFARLMTGLFHSDFLPQEIFDQVFTPFVGEYGLGWAVKDNFNRPTYQHTGKSFGFASFMVHYPDDDISIVVFSNIEEMEVRAIACDLFAIASGDVRRLPFDNSFELSQEAAGRLLGVYREVDDEKHTDYEIGQDSGGLYIRWQGRRVNRFRLVPLSENQFTWEGFEELRMYFEPETGAVTTLTVDIAGQHNLTAKRLSEEPE